jgi:iron complex transport system ATP-binding protein
LIETLSGGERQLVALARGLAQGAKILLVDETLSQMDLNHQFVIGHMLKELAQNGWSILLVAHDVNLALEWIDSAILVKNGKKVAQGSVQEVIKPEFMSILYPGVELTIGKSPTNSVPKVFIVTPQATKNTN